MELELIRGSWNYHWWGNRKLFDIVSGLGEETTARELGTQFSFPTVKGMLAHIYGADRVWLERWTGKTPAKLLGDGDFASLADLRKRWDDFELEQRSFVEARDEGLKVSTLFSSTLIGYDAIRQVRV